MKIFGLGLVGAAMGVIALIGYGAQGVRPIHQAEFRRLGYQAAARPISAGLKGPNAAPLLTRLDEIGPKDSRDWPTFYAQNPKAKEEVLRLAEDAVRINRYQFGLGQKGNAGRLGYIPWLNANAVGRLIVHAAREGDASLMRRAFDAYQGLTRLRNMARPDAGYGIGYENSQNFQNLFIADRILKLKPSGAVLKETERIVRAETVAGDWREDVRLALTVDLEVLRAPQALDGFLLEPPGPNARAIYGVDLGAAYRTMRHLPFMGNVALRSASETGQNEVLEVARMLEGYGPSESEARRFVANFLPRHKNSALLRDTESMVGSLLAYYDEDGGPFRRDDLLARIRELKTPMIPPNTSHRLVARR